MCTSRVCVCVGWMCPYVYDSRTQTSGVKKIVLATVACSSGAKLLQCVAVLLACLRSGQRPCAYGSISHWPLVGGGLDGRSEMAGGHDGSSRFIASLLP
jgi:hypothetical protein